MIFGIIWKVCSHGTLRIQETHFTVYLLRSHDFGTMWPQNRYKLWTVTDELNKINQKEKTKDCANLYPYTLSTLAGQGKSKYVGIYRKLFHKPDSLKLSHKLLRTSINYLIFSIFCRSNTEFAFRKLNLTGIMENKLKVNLWLALMIDLFKSICVDNFSEKSKMWSQKKWKHVIRTKRASLRCLCNSIKLGQLVLSWENMMEKSTDRFIWNDSWFEICSESVWPFMGRH